MVFRALDANTRKLMNAAEQLVPGSTSAEIGAIGTAHLEGKVGQSNVQKQMQKGGKGGAAGREKFQLANGVQGRALPTLVICSPCLNL